MRVLWRWLGGMALLWCFWAGHAVAAPGLWQIQEEFTDEFGKKAPLSHWATAQTVVSMEYSACKFVCSSNWRRLLEIQAQADKQKLPVHFLIISLDPANDNPAAWRDYRKVRGLARSNWTFVTGNRLATDKVVAALGVKWWVFNDSIMHDFRVLRINDAGTKLAVMDNFEQTVSAFLSN